MKSTKEIELSLIGARLFQPLHNREHDLCLNRVDVSMLWASGKFAVVSADKV
jgi:hypothetical protein